mmetsp:Transcript_4621/g.8993  ORF Transcript_4621/g.8993 Transcript_4621/m.8993 type:complete len:319 (-) Transcript_4621:118-1074(-)|eukprot:CAMPEP_0178698336 /NCGR_PEP_ID=MMETSP0699-20121125/10475_1 /TAXON_ID=265572 /ORGANISM="Extubocellulus spinifer, Strain CCMP396" /LENGTH=318 /DNA_ID=CAMNT_0020344375 /DNA_START=129 /DNA_END=1085 /DNA_ORIENTATION=+
MASPSRFAAAVAVVLFSLASPLSAFVRNHSPSGVSRTNILRSMTATDAATATTATDGDTSSSVSPFAAIPNPPPTKAATAVIFDIDGTLADSWRLGYDATVVVLNSNDLGNIEINEEIYHSHCVYATPERLARHAGLMPGDDDFESVGEDLGRQFDEHYVKLVSSETCAFYPGMMNILEKLPQDVKLGALTNACAAYGHEVLKVNCPVRSALDNTNGLGFSLYSRFGTIHGADTVPAPKPSPEGLLQCARELGLEDDLSNMIYVGDAVGDGRAARAAGMVSVGVLWGSNSEEKLRSADTFDYIVGSVDELKTLLPQQK